MLTGQQKHDMIFSFFVIPVTSALDFSLSCFLYKYNLSFPERTFLHGVTSKQEFHNSCWSAFSITHFNCKLLTRVFCHRTDSWLLANFVRLLFLLRLNGNQSTLGVFSFNGSCSQIQKSKFEPFYL